MGANMVRRLIKGGHQCVVFDMSPKAVQALVEEKAVGSSSLADFMKKLAKPRVVWLMVPAAVTDKTITDLLPHLEAEDILIDGGNSYYIDDIRRAKELAPKKIHYVDVGTSGGIWGLERGYCMMIGGENGVVKHLDPIFATLAPGIGEIERTPGRDKVGGSAEQGYLHCGPNGAGHFVKMVHNGIEYGLMAAYAEGFGILRSANIGKQQHEIDAETTPLRDPEHYQYDFNLGDIAELWRRGSVVASWLLDLQAIALLKDPTLANFGGRVSDSGEGRWTIKAAIDEAVPAHVLTAALYERFSSRGESEFADKLLSAMRYEFGGHVERPTTGGMRPLNATGKDCIANLHRRRRWMGNWCRSSAAKYWNLISPGGATAWSGRGSMSSATCACGATSTATTTSRRRQAIRKEPGAQQPRTTLPSRWVVS
jgi:6-phosphogluconate dehydrogenase